MIFEYPKLNDIQPKLSDGNKLKITHKENIHQPLPSKNKI